MTRDNAYFPPGARNTPPQVRALTNVFAGIVVTIMSLCVPVAARAQKLVFVVRHAERADSGQMQAQTDPALSAAGEARAEKLAGMLRDAGIKGIYATEFRRTRDTAKPLATRLGLVIQALPSRDTPALIADIRGKHANDIVLVVGHSNTVPAIIKTLCGAEVTIADGEYDNLFIVVPGTGTMTRIRFMP
jgi:broad specificity phosphatase PhoE